jgi:outer membrane protein OmpA-like peptidoglycan-associated protein
MLLLLTTIAIASEPVTAVHATGSIGADSVGGGAGGSFGLNAGHFDLELAADATGGTEGLGFVRPQLRWIPSDHRAIGPHVIAGGGLLFAPGGERPVANAGVGIDLMRRPWRPRIEAIGAWLPGDPEWRAFLTVGLVRRPPPVEPVVVADVPLHAFDAAMVWVPGPVCEWLPPAEASEAFLRVGEDPEGVPTLQAPSEAAPEAQRGGVPTGDLVVAGYPGDIVTIDETPFAVASDGIAWTARPEGPATVRVRGGGRREFIDVAVAAGATLWVGTTEPVDAAVWFELGSAIISSAAAAELDTFADQLGAWSVEVWGSFSPEGPDAVNHTLATRRAEAVAARLRLAGVPPEHIRVLPPRMPEADAPPDQQRIAVVHPMETR